MIIELSQAINFNGVEHKTLNLELENLTGQDLIDAEESLRRAGVMTTGAGDFSRNYLITVAAKALKLPREALLGLAAGDFTRIINEVFIFLAGQGLPQGAESAAN